MATDFGILDQALMERAGGVKTWAIEQSAEHTLKRHSDEPRLPGVILKL